MKALPRWVSVTVDVDWAPDCAIDGMAQRLAEMDVPSTWFITHDSAAIDRLRASPELYELGIHPNFLTGSSHGRTPEDVIDHCRALAENPKAVRCHSLVYSSPLLSLLADKLPLEVEASLLMPHAYWARPFEYKLGQTSVVRMPTCWEDDYEWTVDVPCWNARDVLEQAEELAVFTFHPIHVALNSASPEPYLQLRERSPALRDAPPELVTSLANEGTGAASMFESLLSELAGLGHARVITALAADWRNSRRP